MARVLDVSRGDLERRRAAILQRLGVSLEELRARARSSSLIAEEWKAWEELRDISYLLGDDPGA